MTLFNCPVQFQGVEHWLWGRWTIPVGISLIKMNGHYVRVPVPVADELTGTEGIDFFLGGRDYDVTGQVEADLIADGYL